MNISKLANYCLIAIDAIKENKKNKNYSYSTDDKNIIIIFQQVFGDSVVIQNSLGKYTKVFPAKEGYRVHFLVRPSVKAFMEAVLPLPEDISFEAVDFKGFVEDFNYYKEIKRTYASQHGIVIVPGTSLTAEILSSIFQTNRRIGLVKSTDPSWPPTMALFNKIAYTERVKPKDDDMMLQRHRLLLDYLGLRGDKAKLPTLLPKKKIVDEKNYVVFCLGASKAEKCWPAERFAKVADYIIDKYKWKIHLCGGSDEEKFGKAFVDYVNNPKMVVNHIGKTSFSDWSAIVQHAELVIGNDSATLHIAVAARVKSICIVGVYDKYQFFPYKVDELDEGDRLPVTLFKDMPCEWCRTYGYYAGYKNKECKKKINRGECAMCIEEISIDEVITAVEEALKQSVSTWTEQ